MGIIKKTILAIVLFLVLVLFINCVIHYAWTAYVDKTTGKTIDIFQSLAVSLIISWVIYLVGFYVWAIQFYNVNLGWTDEEWEKQKDIKNVNPRAAVQEPDENPNMGESLGLPSGTVRASIALSLLVAGLAMTIASLSMNNTYPANVLFIDHFEFFKTAFLMMIAFYFGAKSLDILRKTNISSSTLPPQNPKPPANPDPAPAVDPVIEAKPGTLNDPQAKG